MPAAYVDLGLELGEEAEEGRLLSLAMFLANAAEAS